MADGVTVVIPSKRPGAHRRRHGAADLAPARRRAGGHRRRRRLARRHVRGGRGARRPARSRPAQRAEPRGGERPQPRHRGGRASLDRVPGRRRPLEPGQAAHPARTRASGEGRLRLYRRARGLRRRRPGPVRRPRSRPMYVHEHIRSRNLVFAGSSNVVARATLLRRLGGFDEALHHIADWDLWIRLTEAGRAGRVPGAARGLHRARDRTCTARRSTARRGRGACCAPSRRTAACRAGSTTSSSAAGSPTGQAQWGRLGRAALTYAVTAAAPPQPSRRAARSGRSAARGRSCGVGGSRRPTTARRPTGYRCARSSAARASANVLGSSSSSSARPSSSRSKSGVTARSRPPKPSVKPAARAAGGDARSSARPCG